MIEIMQPVQGSPSSSFNYLALVWSILKVLWPFLLVLVAARLLPLLPQVLRRRRLSESGIHEIDAMDGRTFEDCLAALFSRQGFEVEVTPYRGDWGADLVLVKAGIRTVVQAKRYKKSVGVRAVQEAVAAKAKYRCSEAMVVTNATFTRQAIELARVNKVALWGREELVRHLLRERKAREGKNQQKQAA